MSKPIPTDAAGMVAILSACLAIERELVSADDAARALDMDKGDLQHFAQYAVESTLKHLERKGAKVKQP